MNAPLKGVPILEPGDHLTREEFERRYEAMPGVKKAELIEGVVYMPSPTRAEHHGNPHFDLILWLGTYRLRTPGVKGSNNCSLRLDHDNELMPDAVLYVEPGRGGQVRLSDDDYFEGAPELVTEVSSSTVSIDLKTKLQVYRRNGVKEYIVWRVGDQAIDWFVLRKSQYEPLPAGPDGYHKSEVLPGLWLDVAALARGELDAAMQALEKGLASPEHAAFVENLRRAGGTSAS